MYISDGKVQAVINEISATANLRVVLLCHSGSSSIPSNLLGEGIVLYHHGSDSLTSTSTYTPSITFSSIKKSDIVTITSHILYDLWQWWFYVIPFMCLIIKPISDVVSWTVLVLNLISRPAYFLCQILIWCSLLWYWEEIPPFCWFLVIRVVYDSHYVCECTDSPSNFLTIDVYVWFQNFTNDPFAESYLICLLIMSLLFTLNPALNIWWEYNSYSVSDWITFVYSSNTNMIITFRNTSFELW